MSTNTTKTKPALPLEEIALEYLSICFTYKQQPFRRSMFDYLLTTYGKVDGAKIDHKVEATFNSLKKTVSDLLPLVDEDADINITTKQLGSGKRHLHPRLFTKHGFHRIYTNRTIMDALHEEEGMTFKQAFSFYMQDCASHPSGRGKKPTEVGFDEEVESDVEPPKKKKRTEAPAEKPTIIEDSQETNNAPEEEEEIVEITTSADKKKARAPTKKTTEPKTKKATPKPAKKAAESKKRGTKRKRDEESEDEWDLEN